MSIMLLLGSLGLFYFIGYRGWSRILAQKVFCILADESTPAHDPELRDDIDFLPVDRHILWGHHYTSIAGAAPIIGPAVAVIWGWMPALFWIVFGTLFIGAVHDFGALVVSMRSRGQTVGDVAGRVINRRVRLLFLLILFMALTIVLAIFGLVIASVFRQYPASIFPCLVQIPIAVLIGLWLHRKGVNLLIPSVMALVIMYLTVIFGGAGVLGSINSQTAKGDTEVWKPYAGCDRCGVREPANQGSGGEFKMGVQAIGLFDPEVRHVLDRRRTIGE